MPGYAEFIGMALRKELGETRGAIKSTMRWTGASERTVKYWFAGHKGPGGKHLMLLLRHSNAVFDAVASQAGRKPLTAEHRMVELRAHLIDAVAAIDRLHTTETTISD
jgi:hypothetical protein